MQTQKMSLANIKGKLSRAEMKNIMAGSGNEYKCCWDKYPNDCSVCVVNGSSCVAGATLKAC